MKLLDGVKEPETLSNLYYFCLDIIEKSNVCRRGPRNVEVCVDLELQYNNGIEKDTEFVKKFNNLLQHNKELLSVESFCNNNNNNIGQNNRDFLNFINLLILRLEEKRKNKNKYERPEINYFSDQIIFNYINMYIIGNPKIIKDMKSIPKKILNKIGKSIVPSQSLPAYSVGSAPRSVPNYPPPRYYAPSRTASSNYNSFRDSDNDYGWHPFSNNSNYSNNENVWLGGSRKKKIQRKRKTKKTKKNKK